MRWVGDTPKSCWLIPPKSVLCVKSRRDRKPTDSTERAATLVATIILLHTFAHDSHEKIQIQTQEEEFIFQDRAAMQDTVV